MADGTGIKRKRNKSENRISNQTLPRLAGQVFEKQLMYMSDLDKKEFPVCRYKQNQEYIRGLFPSEEAYKLYRNLMECMSYWREGGPAFIVCFSYKEKTSCDIMNAGLQTARKYQKEVSKWTKIV